MFGIADRFGWKVPSQGFRWMFGNHRSHHPRFSRGGISYRSGDGYIENDLLIDESLTPFLVPIIEEADALSSGYDEHDWDNELVANVLSGPNPSTYRPLDQAPALFMEFAQLRAALSDIREFANQWGALGSEITCGFESAGGPHPSGKPPPKPMYWGEAIGAWASGISEMSWAVEMWELAESKDEHLLSEHIWQEGDTILWGNWDGDKPDPDLYSSEGIDWAAALADPNAGEDDGADYELPLMAVVGDYVCAPHKSPERLAIIEKHGLQAAARFVVSDLVTEGLRGRVSAVLASVGPQEPDIPLSTRILPHNLIGALWLQLALAVEQSKSYRQCFECAKWFEVAPGVGRPEKQYCSDACRMRAYRKRKTDGKVKRSDKP